jgi:hypothetical protein
LTVNYYKVLNVLPDANIAEIKSAYRKLARKLHPDMNGGTEEATQKFALIARAYEVLSNPDERAYHDRQINGDIHDSDSSVIYSENSHARRMRQAAYERYYNQIVDQILDAERKESIARQKLIFPIVGLFISTFFISMFRPLIWTNSEPLGKIIVLTLFTVGIVHLIGRLYSGFKQFTHNQPEIHESILDGEEEEISKPFPRWTAISFLLGGLFIFGLIGFALGSYLKLFMEAMLPNLFSLTFELELLFFPPIVVLVIDLMHLIATKLEA